MNARCVYVSCADPPEIHRYAIDAATGALSPIDIVAVEHPPYPEGTLTSTPLALSPDQSRLYVAVRTPPFPGTSFAVERGGALRPLGVASLANQFAYIATDQTGRYLLAASYQGSLVACHAIDAEGRLQSPAQQVIATPLASHSILPDPSNRFVFVANLSSDTILRFAFDATSGRLSPLDPVPAPHQSGPRHLRFSPSQRFLYVINEHVGTINAYGFDRGSGALSLRHEINAVQEGAAADGSVFAADIQITPDGRFLYGSIRTTNTLAAFRLDPDTGAMTPIGIVPSEDTPRAFAIDPSGRFLYCAGQKSNQVGIYAIDGETGALTRTGTQKTGGNPNWLTFLV